MNLTFRFVAAACLLQQVPDVHDSVQADTFDTLKENVDL